MLLFPLVIMQFFSSGLIMWGDTVREALVLTMGRDLCMSKGIRIEMSAQTKQIFKLDKSSANNIPVEDGSIDTKGPNNEI